MSSDLDVLARAVAEARSDWLDLDGEIADCQSCDTEKDGRWRCDVHQLLDCWTSTRMETATAAYRAARPRTAKAEPPADYACPCCTGTR